MRKSLSSVVGIACSLLLAGCFGGIGEEPQSEYKAVVMTRTEFEKSVTLESVKPITTSGKIYIKDNLLLINDVDLGFHVYYYVNAQTPIKIAFIKIPGATDVAIRNNILYINQAVDLVAINYDPNTGEMTVTNRNRNVFPPKMSPDGFHHNTADNKVVISWKQ